MNIDYILNRVKSEEDKYIIKKAYVFLCEYLMQLDDIDFNKEINYILDVINMLLDFNADSLTLVSGILYRVINYGVNIEEIEKKFGFMVVNIIVGISKINKLENTDNFEGIIKYLEGLNPNLSENIRVLFIKLVDRYYSMKIMDTLQIDLYQKKIATDTLDILVPIAGRFGLNYIKSKLEDLCLYYLKPDEYNDILIKLNALPSELNIYLDNMKDNISNLLLENNIKFIIKSRVKSIYSIYNKLYSGREWEDIYDVLAIRIIVEDKIECNKVLELIHSKYESIPSRLKDYINFPKENMYQSLHTTIIGDDNRYYEIQIRTFEMNMDAEKGRASHHLYKEKQRKKLNFRM